MACLRFKDFWNKIWPALTNTLWNISPSRWLIFVVFSFKCTIYRNCMFYILVSWYAPSISVDPREARLFFMSKNEKKYQEINRVQSTFEQIRIINKTEYKTFFFTFSWGKLCPFFVNIWICHWSHPNYAKLKQVHGNKQGRS